MGPLVDAEALAALIERGEVLVCDCRFDLSDPSAGRRAYAAGHVPGAIYVDLEADLSGATNGQNGRHPLPDRAQFAAKMAHSGVRKGVTTVAYDTSGGVYAARLWWMLRWIGHAQAAILDGGIAAWTAAGFALREGIEMAAPGDVEASAEPGMPVCQAEEIIAAIGTDRLRVIDARSAERFAGAAHPLDAVPGHIPGAVNRFFSGNMTADGRLKSPELLAEEFGAVMAGITPDRTVHQCGSGVTAALNLLAMEHAGLHGSALYPGSWSEWVSDPKRPIARQDMGR